MRNESEHKEMAVFVGKHKEGAAFLYKPENKWYVADSNFYVDAADLEDGWDVQMENGWHTNAHEAVSEQDLALVSDVQAKEAERQSDLYRSQNTATFLPEVGQRIISARTGVRFTIVELSKDNHMIRVRADGKKDARWYHPYNFRLIDHTGEERWYDLNDEVR